MDLNQWSDSLLRETYNKWSSLEGKYEFWKSGFAVFYSPVYENPDLMIIGYNPGGDSDTFNEKEALLIPEEHEYFKWNYPLAKKMRETIFNKINKTDLLRKSIKLNLIFFRSNNKKCFTSISREVRKDIEQFCHGKVREIIIPTKPKIVIAEGIITYDKLKLILKQQPFEFKAETERCSLGNNGRRIYCNIEACKKIDSDVYCSGYMFLSGLLHLSGARPSENEFRTIRERLGDDLTEKLKIAEATRNIINNCKKAKV